MQNVAVLDETCFRFSEVKQHVKDTSYWQLHRWAMHGYGVGEPKVSLEWARRGNTLYTSKEAVRRFERKINEPR